jgi:hypothetical protein
MDVVLKIAVHKGCETMSGSLPDPWFLLPLRGSHRAVLRRKSHYAVSDLSLCAGCCPALTGQLPLGSFRIVSAFAAAVAPCHRSVPDEMSVQFFGGAFQA